ncbi:unnamed protein product [Vicia faba]|uniref:Uncharacterized protein n=1 Tax=Vicia faba TaxID=3906 RepID=A0AAV0YTE4_VICFA|nr:unnamed protein product [Vicia faba]
MDPNPPKPILPNLNLSPPVSPEQELPVVPQSPQQQPPPNSSPPQQQPPPNSSPQSNSPWQSPTNLPSTSHSPPQQPLNIPPQPQILVQDPQLGSPDSWPDPDASPQESWPEEPQPSPPHEYLVQTTGGVYTVTLPHSPRSHLRPDVLSTPETSDSLPDSSGAPQDTASRNTSPLPPSQ